jgi:hypothetical protein
MGFKFKCNSCDEVHEGLPIFSIEEPYSYLEIPDKEKADRCELKPNYCRINDQWFFIYGLIEIQVIGYSESLTYGVWGSISKSNYDQWRAMPADELAAKQTWYFAWLNVSLAMYPETFNMKANVHIRGNGELPLFELEPTDHPLAIEQRTGVSEARVAEIYSHILHPSIN